MKTIRQAFMEAAQKSEYCDDLLSIAEVMKADGQFSQDWKPGKPLSKFNGKSFRQVDRVNSVGFKWDRRQEGTFLVEMRTDEVELGFVL